MFLSAVGWEASGANEAAVIVHDSFLTLFLGRHPKPRRE